MVTRFAAFLGSYLIGSIPTAYLLVKWFKRIDVRTIGSGNVGATNAARVAGVKVAALVFLIDAAKGLIAVRIIAPWLFQPATLTGQLSCGLMAILGHNFPIFLAFRGGKGVSTTLGVLLGTMPAVAGVCLLMLVVCVLISRYVSVGALAAAVTLPVAQLLTHQTRSEVLLGAVLAFLVIVQHRANIGRLLQGREHRIGKTS